VRAALNEAAQPQVIGEEGEYSDENGNIGWRNDNELYNSMNWDFRISSALQTPSRLGKRGRAPLGGARLTVRVPQRAECSHM